MIENRLKNFLCSLTEERARQFIETVDVLIDDCTQETLRELKRFNPLLNI